MRLVSADEFEGSTLVRTTAACIASILDAEPAEVPAGAGLAEPWTAWRNWLGRRALGLVPVADAASFSWPGPWIALLGDPAGPETEAAVAFGVPSDLVWQPLGTARAFEEVRTGFVLAPADVALWSQNPHEAARLDGAVDAIALAPLAGAPMEIVQEAQAVAGRGLAGDRYGAGGGTFSNPNARGVDLTLIEREALDDLAAGGVEMPAEGARRNVVTSGVDLNALVGQRFFVGEVECFGQRLCEPCAHLQRLTAPGVLRALVHRGGLRADVVTSGTIRVGDRVTSP